MALALAACACEREPAATPRSARTPTPVDTTTLAAVVGAVRFGGAAPAPVSVTLAGDPTCAALHPGGLVLAPVRVADGLVADAFVYVKSGLEDRVFAVPEKPVVIDQRGCLFVPAVAGAQVDQPIRFLNGDDTIHNVHGTPAASAGWNFAMPRRGATRTLTITEPEVMVEVRCEVHPWMRAHLGVLPHPYFAVTGADGRFALARLPAGRYVLAVWHAYLGTRERAVTLEPGARAEVDFDFGR